MQLSKLEKAQQAILSEDGMSVTSHKGYRMVRRPPTFTETPSASFAAMQPRRDARLCSINPDTSVPVPWHADSCPSDDHAGIFQ